MANREVLSSDAAVGMTGYVTIRAKAHLFAWWARIAVKQEAQAKKHRADGLDHLRDRSGDPNWLMHESETSMASITASSFAIDGVYGLVLDGVRVPQSIRDRWDANRLPREARIFETFKFGFVLGDRTNSWPMEFTWLFGLRDKAVHFRGEFADVGRHPSGTNASAESVEYCSENATRAVDLLFDVIDVCSSKPRRALPALVIEPLKSVDWLRASRTELRAGT